MGRSEVSLESVGTVMNRATGLSGTRPVGRGVIVGAYDSNEAVERGGGYIPIRPRSSVGGLSHIDKYDIKNLTKSQMVPTTRAEGFMVEPEYNDYHQLVIMVLVVLLMLSTLCAIRYRSEWNHRHMVKLPNQEPTISSAAIQMVPVQAVSLPPVGSY